MGTQRDNGVWSPGATEPIDWHVSPTIMGAAADIAISGRSDLVRAPRLLAATALTAASTKAAEGHLAGDQIHRTDIGTIEELTPSGWRVIFTVNGIAFTPDWAAPSPASAASLTPGNAGQSWLYWINGETVTVVGLFVVGSTTSISSSVLPMRLPPAPGMPMRYSPSSIGAIGSAHATNGALHYLGEVIGLFGDPSSVIESSGIVTPAVIFKGNGRATNGMSPAWPFTWASGMTFSVNYSYQT